MPRSKQQVIKDHAGGTRRLGYVPDLPDIRDFSFSQTPFYGRIELPEEIDLRPYMTPVKDQGSIGSCTGQSLAALREFLEVKEQLKLNGDSRIVNGGTEVAQAISTVRALSPLFIYYFERVYMGTVKQDSGAYLRDGMKVLNKLGACLESLWPHDKKRLFVEPDSAAKEDASKNQVIEYYRIDNSLLEMKTALAQHMPFVGGWTLYESFMSADTARTGVIPMPSRREGKIGGHAMIIVGYRDKDRKFIVKNSWGSGWGCQGYAFMDYDYCVTLGGDFWTAKKWE